MAGIMVFYPLHLAHFVSLYWLWLTAFVGLNLLQSAFTNWCPAMSGPARAGAEGCRLRSGSGEEGVRTGYDATQVPRARLRQSSPGS